VFWKKISTYADHIHVVDELLKFRMSGSFWI